MKDHAASLHGPVGLDRLLLDEAGEGSPWILVAEDDPEMLRLVVGMIVDEGHVVVSAGSGLELFDLLREARRRGRPPSAVVTDVRMPGLTGLQVVRTIRSWGMETPVLLITAFPDEATEAQAGEDGAEVLAKPFDLEDLRIAVAGLVAGARPPGSTALPS